VASAASRPTPLTIVSAAVAGDDLQSVAGAASDALGCPVAIAIPAIGPVVVSPADSVAPASALALAEHAEAASRGQVVALPPAVSELVPVRIGREVAGVVAAFGRPVSHPERRAWLEAAAAAAAVAALMRKSHGGDPHAGARELLLGLAAGPPKDTEALVAHGRRLGFELEGGAIALWARWPSAKTRELPSEPGALLVDAGHGVVLGLVATTASARARALGDELTAGGASVALSSPRRDPAELHEALREAELMVELAHRPETMLAGQEETYRLLIGVLLRDPAQLEELRTRTVSPLARYDAGHDTDLLATLKAFLAHDGSTTETAEAMRLHRHTVGYRLARVHEVSGLSPYESDGRERLSLGLKADQILEADGNRREHE
jgi:hypothetical protein